jgi:hypothetical protein
MGYFLFDFKTDQTTKLYIKINRGGNTKWSTGNKNENNFKRHSKLHSKVDRGDGKETTKIYK